MASKATPQRGSIIDAKDLRHVLRIASKNWYFVAVALALSAVLSYLYSYKLPDIYGARTQILLKDREVYDYQSQVYKNIGYVGIYSDIVNQKRVLTSYDMVNKTLDKLDFDVSYYIVGRFKATQQYGTMPFTVEMQPLNQALFDKPIELKVLDFDHYEIRFEKGAGTEVRRFRFNKEERDPDFIITIRRQSYLTKKAVEDLTAIDYRFVRHQRAKLVAQYMRSIKVINQEFTSILEVMVEDEVAQRAQRFLDSLSATYIAYTLQSEIDINEKTISYIDRQLDEVTVILEEHEDEMQRYKESKDVLNLVKEEGLYFNEMVSYDKRSRMAELEIEALDALESYLLSSHDERLLPPSAMIIEDRFINEMLGTLYGQQIQRNNMLMDGTEANLSIIRLDSTIRRNRLDLLTYIGNARASKKERVKDLKDQMYDYEGLLRKLPKSQRDILNIQRRLNVNEKMYLFLLEKRASTIIARAGIVPTTKVIEAARSMGVVRPDKLKIFYMFMLGGLVVASIVVFIRVMFYDRIENADQLKDLTQLPIYGEIIASDKAEQNYVVVDSDPKAAITESFRTVRTNLEYIPAQDGMGKVVMVTSYRPNEGKTFCSVNLSAILAKAGKRVLLLELDLHKPKVATGLGMSNPVGLSNVLVGKVGWRDVVLATQFENFFVMLSGPTPPNASELVLSKHLEELFREARQEYDYIMVDTPPVGLITDALLMMRHVDATLFVVNTRFASKDHVTNVLEALASSPVKNTGFILNGVRMKKSKYYYNTNYGYGYRYAYGYGKGGYGYGYGYGYGRRSKRSDNVGGDKPDTKA